MPYLKNSVLLILILTLLAFIIGAILGKLYVPKWLLKDNMKKNYNKKNRIIYLNYKITILMMPFMLIGLVWLFYYHKNQDGIYLIIVGLIILTVILLFIGFNKWYIKEKSKTCPTLNKKLK